MQKNNQTKWQEGYVISKKCWSSAFFFFCFHAINCSVSAEQFTLNSEGSESILESTYIKQCCKNIFFGRQEASNHCERGMWMWIEKEHLGQGHSKPWMSHTATWHFKYLRIGIYLFIWGLREVGICVRVHEWKPNSYTSLSLTAIMPCWLQSDYSWG